ncbi:hypothetical protein [Chitinophaga sp.]|uniref:hypothetical protein n=1 Tax=Chitinophaga sp. TaxID=1869181 RepID=UPI002CBD75A1|nr:hypothetical protein [Chitinophaga sp.]HWV64367.1 hypothetical protein [Chitinophaga sp.]
MNFTTEHIEVLERHKEHWDSLRTVQFMRNLDKKTFDDIQKVHNEAIAEVHFSSWCGDCVAEMVRITYTQYDKFKEANPEEFEKKPRKKKEGAKDDE